MSNNNWEIVRARKYSDGNITVVMRSPRGTIVARTGKARYILKILKTDFELSFDDIMKVESIPIDSVREW